MSSPLPVIFDDPPGKALTADLEGNIVVTALQGVPYLSDVLERKPRGLLVQTGPSTLAEHLQALFLTEAEFIYKGPHLPASPLSPCERYVLRLIACGLSNREIAARAGKKVCTVNTQVSAILSKLGVQSRHEARNLYWGYASPPPPHLDK